MLGSILLVGRHARTERELRRAPLRAVLPIVAVVLVACSGPSAEELLRPFEPSSQDLLRGFEEEIRAENVNPAAVVLLSEARAVAAVAGDRRVRVIELLAGEDRPGRAPEVAGGDHGGRSSSAELVTLGGDTGQEWNTFFFGTAPESVSSVVLDGFDARGGEVVDGAWVLVLREKGVKPDELHWRFVDSSGRVVDSGIGILPQD